MRAEVKTFILFISIFLLSISSIDINAMTRDELMTYIADNFGHQVAGRQIVKSPKFFSSRNATFIKIKKDGLIIFKDQSFSSQTGEVTFYGITKKGEVLQFLRKQQMVALPNFLSNAPDPSGFWYQVKTADGHIGWIYAGENQADVNKTLTVVKPSSGKVTAKSKGKEVKKGESVELGYVIGGMLVFIVTVVLIIKFSTKEPTGDKPVSIATASLGGHSASYSSPVSTGSQEKVKSVPEKVKKPDGFVDRDERERKQREWEKKERLWAEKQKDWEKKSARSRSHVDIINRMARSAEPSSDSALADMLLTIGTGGLNVLFGALTNQKDLLNQRREYLQSCSRKLKEAHSYFESNKEEILGADRAQVGAHLASVQESLKSAWENFDKQKDKAWESFKRAEEEREREKIAKQAAREERQRQHEQKQREWEERKKQHEQRQKEREERERERERKRREWEEKQRAREDKRKKR